MLYRIADFLIDIEPRFPLMRKHLEEYAYEGEGKADFSVRVTDEMLEKQRAAQPEFSLPYHESTCILRVISDTVVHRGCFLMHAAVIAVDGVAYAFTAKSGTDIDLNVPYLAFYGDWTQAPLLDLDYFQTDEDDRNESLLPEDKAPVFLCAAPVCPGHVPYVTPPFHPLRRIYAQNGWNMWNIYRYRRRVQRKPDKQKNPRCENTPWIFLF